MHPASGKFEPERADCMQILYYDCYAGISGDMNLGAMVDLGVDPAYLISELSRLKLDNEFRLEVSRKQKMGITGTKVDVILAHESHSHEECHDLECGTSEHTRSEAGGHTEHHHHGHRHADHRNLKDIAAIIDASDLSPAVRARAIRMFRLVAEAEAKVHGKTVDEVHFHEVGAVDSIVDIVGAAICIEKLAPDRVISSPVQVGGGFVRCAHGLFPVPAPATAEILKHIPIRSGLVGQETTTPTGAAILAANTDEFAEECRFRIEKVGYGLGTRDLGIPNALRVYLASGSEDDGDTSNISERQFMLETNIDDMNPELYGYIEELLFEKGALDVFKTPVIMKKGRPAVKLSVLVDGAHEEAVRDIIFRETTALGLRRYAVEKVMMDRSFESIGTKYGEITVKRALSHGKTIKYKPEYEECRKAAREKGVPIREIYEAVASAMENKTR